MNQYTLIKALLKAKNDKTKELDQLVESFLKEFTKSSRADTEKMLSELFVLIYEKYEDIDKASLLSMCEAKLESLAIKAPTESLPVIYEAAATLGAAALSTKFSFDRTDAKSIEVLTKSFVWMGQDASVRTQESLKDILIDVFTGELDRSEVATKLKEEFPALADKTERQIKAGSELVIRRTQHIAQAKQALKIGMPYFKIIAKNGGTTQICRSLHGKLIPASHIRNQIEMMESASSVGEQKKAHNLSGDSMSFFDVKSIPADIGLPPYHFGCYTTYAATEKFESVVDGKKIEYTKYENGDKYNGKRVEFAHIDKTGTERIVTEKAYNHGGRFHQVSKKDTISALNSITNIAAHSKTPARQVAMSQNGYFMVFESGELWTIYKPDNLKKHYENSAEKSTKEVIKWQENSTLGSLMGTLSTLKKRIRRMA